MESDPTMVGSSSSDILEAGIRRVGEGEENLISPSSSTRFLSPPAAVPVPRHAANGAATDDAAVANDVEAVDGASAPVEDSLSLTRLLSNLVVACNQVLVVVPTHSCMR